MKIECKDLNHVLREGTPELMEAAKIHAEECPSCSRKLECWNALSEAAGTLKRDWETPELWPRIDEALANEAEAHRKSMLRRLSELTTEGYSRRYLAVAAISLLVVVSASWMATWYFRAPGFESGVSSEKRLLTERALRDVEISESAYIQSIEKLSKIAEPKIDNAAAPILVMYREKLTLIDGAIAECRAGIERNPLNAHMRLELLAMYQEKQRTLEDLLRTTQNEERKRQFVNRPL